MNKLSKKYTREIESSQGIKSNTIDWFVYFHGLFNCKWMSFRKKEEIYLALEKEKSIPFSDLEKKDIEFIEKYAGTEVVVYVLGSKDINPDLFVYPDDNIPFSLGCFH